jgi:multisubunit Na+/H+ antiporter MnhB subunit
MSDRSAAGGRPLATVAAVVVLLSAIVALPVTWVAAAVNTRPTSGDTFIDYPVSRAGNAPEQPIGGDGSNWEVGEDLTVETSPSWQVTEAYYAPGTVQHLVVFVSALVIAIVAVQVIRRRPLSRLVAAALAALGVVAVAAGYAAPRLMYWAAQRVVETQGLPTTQRQAEAAGLDFWVSDPDIPSGLLMTLFGIGCLLAAGYVAHLRRLQRVGQASSL